MVLGVAIAHSDHLLDRLALLDRGAFLLYNTYVSHLLFMEIKFYSTPGCRYCEKLKELFERANINDYQDIQATSTEMKKDYPNATSFPYVVIDGEEVGGLVETAKFFLENGLVSAPKK